MSTINSYFKARKNKNGPVYISDKAKAYGTVVQAPAKIQSTKKEASPKGILRYMSPIKQEIKKDVDKEREEEEDDEEEHVVCKIKKPTKLTDFWKDVVDNYDTDSNELLDNGRKRTHNDDTPRNVRIRISDQTLQTDMPDYYYDDDNEDLSRPIKRRFSLTETNDYLLEIVNELFMEDNSWCKLKPISAMS